ncbi:hypothetical protein [Paramagnetospirillum magneticum]|uniref:Uncharacterized protein n=1 Tax=Paramagnetospirillum magneticum (strain ATCC 700264 / AMB-1) TaxID=342108 RepID=Q2W6N2_PARM1|nr:hypothetical protein [Paramagnetospirillum magneticum]BAE50493.1 hypothetical protein amb1689 [Paramagnetospirillum magneticum AMB-1]
MSIATPYNISTTGDLPSLSSILSDPHRALPRLIHAQISGLPRAHQDSAMLAEAIADGYIAVDTVVLPWRPMLTETLLDEILADEPGCNESEDHRVLKVHARLLAVANDPRGQLEPEAAATSGRYPLRADLIVWHANGVSESYECGATDGRSIIEQLQDGQVRVTILPFAGLSMPFIHGYGFRMAANPSPRELTTEDGMQAWAQILAARPTSFPSLPSMLF